MEYIYSFDELSIPFWVKVLFWGLYMIVFVYTVWKMFISASGNKRRVEVSKLFVLYFAAYAVFYCVNPDYFRYRDWVFEFDFDIWNKELLYIYLVLFCRHLPIHYPFELFRLIVWGGALLLVYFTSRLYRSLLTPELTLLLLFVLYSGTFSYARASLAMAVFFMGISLYLWTKNPFIKMSALGLAMSSIYFHHEMIIGVAVLPTIFIPFEKKQYKFLSVFLFVIVIIFINYINSNLDLMESLFESDEIAEKMEELNNQEQGAFRLSTFIKYANFFYPFFLITQFLHRQTFVPKPIAGIYRVTYALLMASAAFMIVSGLRSTYTYRVMYITMIPISIMITYYYNNGFLKKHQLAIIFLLAMLTNSSRLINAT